MPYLTVNDVKMYYEDSAIQDPSAIDKPVVVFAHGLLWSCRMYDLVIADLAADYRCIAYDFRGQGKSQVTDSGYDMDTLTQDTSSLLNAMQIRQCHFVGLSMGGFVGMRLAVLRPEMIQSLCLLNTAADEEPKGNHPKYRLLAFIARTFSLKLVLKSVFKVMFSQTFLKQAKGSVELNTYREWLLNNDIKGMDKAVHGVIDRTSFTEELQNVKTPTLVLAGGEDEAIHTQRSERLHNGIQDSQLQILARVGHMSVLEKPELIRQLLREFLITL